ncbi:NADPH:quinone reductase [Nocardioides litoris]|uniref:NADPH:quinone reductase n=1 Tax=Nocardioides litoris TaxID=1926648 RepID=UPI00111E90C4|nr:NADPH:quinone reductase [Nocardioides litoris]
MRAVVYSENGPSSVLRLEELPDPTPGPGEVVVRLVRAGVNPTDWKFRAGMMPKAHEVVAPGQDGAGTVEAVGDGVTGLTVGDRVWLRMVQHGRPIGTASELVVVPAELAAPLPDDASYDLGAALGVPAVTAHRALTLDERRLEPGSYAGRTVLVQGGAGAVGNAAIQLAVWAGATVVTTVSSDEKAALARAAGAHHVVDYKREDVVARVLEVAPDGVDLVVEVAPAVNLAQDLELVAQGATIAFYANDGGDEATLPLRPSFSKNLRLQGVLLYTVPAERLQAAADDVTAAVAAGALRAGEDAGVPLHHFPLAETAAAHDAVEGGAVGKVLIDLA